MKTTQRIRRPVERQRGVAVSEFALALPILLILIMATVDFGRYVYSMQIVNDLAREAGMLVSRGVTYDQTFDTTFGADAPLDVQNHGWIIISRIRRHSVADPQPWIFDQQSAGAISGSSRVGTEGGPANLPDITELETGVTMMAVEISHQFQPLFAVDAFGLNVYEDSVYNAAIF
jgi:Flp pilus assembly protein TadG